MKKTLSLFLAFSFVLSGLGFVVGAIETECFVYEFDIDGVSYTVEFLDDGIPASERAETAQRLIVREQAETGTYGWICDALGHNYGEASSTIITTHKVFDDAPRCVVEYVDIYTCERCGYQYYDQLRVEYIDCCPED